MTKKILLCSLLMFLAALPFAACEEKVPKRDPGARTAVPYRISAPDVNLQDIAGKVWRMKDFRGKVVMLDFTTTWCPYCLKDIPKLKKVYERYRPLGLEFASIYIQESSRKVSSFAEKHSLPYPVLLDPDARAAMSYGVRGVPTKVIIGRDGYIVCWMCSDSDIETSLQKLLKK